MLVAEGAVDVAAEPDLQLYDMAALVPVVVEAGGRFTSLDGVDGPFGGERARDERASCTSRCSRALGATGLTAPRPERSRSSASGASSRA